MFDARSSDAMEPLSIAILKSLTPPDVETVFHDERLEELPLDEPADLVAITVETFTARRSYQIADAYRRRGIPVVMGGYHPTFLPEECLEHADAVVEGDAEGIWPKVVADARRKALQPRYRSGDSGPLTGVAPDRSIFAGKRYAPVMMVQYGRGCRFSCDFCSIHAFYGSKLRQRPIADVVAEIEAGNPRVVFLVDDNIFVNPEQARALFEALVPLRIKWTCQVSIDIVKYPDLVSLMAKSGCISATVGFESLDSSNLKQMRKQWNVRWSDYETSIRLLQDAGIMIYGTFVFGYDSDTADSFERTVDFALENRFYLANFNPLTPTPATPLLDRMRREERLIYDHWWVDPAYRYGLSIFRPRSMTPEELTDGCLAARTRFNTYSSIASRFLGSSVNRRTPVQAGIYLLSNLISRREIRRKQGRRLGEFEPVGKGT